MRLTQNNSWNVKGRRRAEHRPHDDHVVDFSSKLWKRETTTHKRHEVVSRVQKNLQNNDIMSVAPTPSPRGDGGGA